MWVIGFSVSATETVNFETDEGIWKEAREREKRKDSSTAPLPSILSSFLLSRDKCLSVPGTPLPGSIS